MNHSFKPLALATAVAAVSSGVAQAQPSQPGAYPSLGDAAFVPYYTVEDNWVTGVHIINTSDLTQVVKLRLRRAEDSLDVLDFNLILSPYDEWTGTISGDDESMEFITEDNSCTAPELLPTGDGKTYAPVFGPRIEGAQEGYLEVIGMAQADDLQPISENALHNANGVPKDCDAVRENFFLDAISPSDGGITLEGDADSSVYGDTDDVLKVSYFIRDNDSGIEFGNNAVHFRAFAIDPMMTHQQFGLENYGNDPAGALLGWDFPDVRGGGSNTPFRDSYNVIVRPSLGANSVLNDWSYNPATGAATDWVITFPGQYALVDFYQLEAGLEDDEMWDYREIPVTATFSVYDREEGSAVPGGLNFSPSPAPDAAFLDYEVNVITWGGEDVLHSNYVTAVNPAEAGITSPVGWASLAVSAADPQGLGNAWCDVAAGEQANNTCTMNSVSGPVPMVGFAAWERTFAEDSNRNYGRIVEHSFVTSGSGFGG